MCGTACGACAATESCLQGTCKEALSSQSSPLVLRLLGREVTAGHITKVTLAVDLVKREQEPFPRMVDFRIVATKPVWLKSAVPGPALTKSGKSLQPFPPWNDPFRKRVDGSFQVLAYDAADTALLSEGRIATLEFALDELAPITLRLLKREQTFAPGEADAALQTTDYDGTVVVTR